MILHFRFREHDNTFALRVEAGEEICTVDIDAKNKNTLSLEWQTLKAWLELTTFVVTLGLSI